MALGAGNLDAPIVIETNDEIGRLAATLDDMRKGLRRSYNELYQRNDPAAALPRLRRAVSARDATASIREEARELLAAVELDLGQVASSRATIERLIATTHDSLRRQRGELFRAQLPLAENKPAESLALFRKFLKDHPNSPYRKQVSDMLEKASAASTSR